MLTAVTIEAPCKINLYLWVGERRSDGFHSIESLFVALNLCDTLDFEFSGSTKAGEEVYVEARELPPHFRGVFDGSRLPPEENLVYRAIKLFKRETGFDRAVRARVYKRIPPAAGLGGASSDAAATLLALRTLSDADLSGERLLEIAAELGSDVPFFASLSRDGSGAAHGAAFVRGRGELIEPIAVPPLDLVIVNPGIASGTREAFSLLDSYRLRVKADVRQALPPQKTYSKNELLTELTKNPAEWRFTNDFLPVFLETAPVKHVYSSVLRDLKRCGALFSGLSGSGSSCFGIFPGSADAANAADSLAAHWPFVRGTAYALA
jgi:4-diphosphocytidyl-2-C-methyl-D-erythritol kinase